MSVYVDSSVLVSFFLEDDFSPAADAFFGRGLTLSYSAWCQAEVSAVVGSRMRSGEFGSAEALVAEAALNDWCRQAGAPLIVLGEDFVSAHQLVRRGELKLRAPDALHLAIVLRSRVSLATFDRGMSDAAGQLGIPLEQL